MDEKLAEFRRQQENYLTRLSYGLGRSTQPLTDEEKEVIAVKQMSMALCEHKHQVHKLAKLICSDCGKVLLGEKGWLV